MKYQSGIRRSDSMETRVLHPHYIQKVQYANLIKNKSVVRSKETRAHNKRTKSILETCGPDVQKAGSPQGYPMEY